MMNLNTASLLEKLVSFNTVNDLPDNRISRDCPDYINDVLSQFGFETQILESDGFYTSLAVKAGGAKSILFLAHFDVVPTGSGWNTDPFKLKIDGDKAYGRGTCDNKGNIVSMMLMAEKLKVNPADCTVILAVSGDEEIGGANGAKHLKDYLLENDMFPDFIVIADGIHQQIIYRRRNILPARIKVSSEPVLVKGKSETIRFETDTFGTESRHSAYFRPGVDRHAMLAASKYLESHAESFISDVRGAFVKSNVIPNWVEIDIVHPRDSGNEHNCDKGITHLIRSLLGVFQASFPTKLSDKGTVICPNILSKEDDIWDIYCDIRAMTNDGDSVRNSIVSLLRERFEPESVFVSSGIGYVEASIDSELILVAKEVLAKVGIPIQLVEGFGGSDSRYFSGLGSDIFDFGPEGDNLHGSNEWVSLKSIEQNAHFFEGLVHAIAERPA